MFTKIKETLRSDEFKSAAKDAALNIGSAIIVGVGIKVVSYVAVEGTRALVNEIKERATGSVEVE